MARFAAIGLDHRHVHDLTGGLLAAGAVWLGGRDPRVVFLDGSEETVLDTGDRGSRPGHSGRGSPGDTTGYR